MPAEEPRGVEEVPRVAKAVPVFNILRKEGDERGTMPVVEVISGMVGIYYTVL